MDGKYFENFQYPHNVKYDRKNSIRSIYSFLFACYGFFFAVMPLTLIFQRYENFTIALAIFKIS